MEAMQRHLDQLEGVQHHPSKPKIQKGASKNENSVSVNQILDLNEPHLEAIMEHQQVKLEMGS
jgi:hypothetical protein